MTKGVQQASIHPKTQEHVALQLHQHLDTLIDPSCSLPKPQTTFLEPQKRWFQKRPKRLENRGRRVWTGPCEDKGA